MRFDRGYLRLFVVNGVAVRVHWSIPLPLLLLFGGASGRGMLLAWALILVGHELGHAFLVRRYGLHVLSLDFHGFGGRCVYAGDPTRLGAAVIAWGGVAAQAILFVLAIGFALLIPGKRAFDVAVVDGLVRYNALMALLNLLPHPSLDGGQAWRAIPLAIEAQRRARRRRSRSWKRPPRRR
jgi:Zn-dependent protease